MKELIKKNLKWIILFICLIVFLALAEDVFNQEIMKCDVIGYTLISIFLITDFATPIAKFITNLAFHKSIPKKKLNKYLYDSLIRISNDVSYKNKIINLRDGYL